MEIDKMLIVGDSFCASKDSNSWTNKFLNYQTETIAMPGCSEYRILKAIEEKSLEKVSKYLGNVLEQVTLKRYSSVREIKEKLIQSEALGVLMSGSGPTVFGIFKDYDSGNKVYKKLSNIYSETYLTRSFNGGNYE